MKPETVKDLQRIGFTIPDAGMEIRLKKNHRKNFGSDIGFIDQGFVFRKLYGIKNERVVFYSNGIGYMLPYFNGIEEILKNEGYEKTESIQLFFEENEIPVDKELARKWKELERITEEFNKKYEGHKHFLEEVEEILHIRKKVQNL